MSKFYILQGELHKIEDLNKHGVEVYANTTYVYEYIRLYNTTALFLEQHIQRVTSTLQSYMIPLPEHIENQRIQRYITRLLNVNKVYKGGICTLMIVPSKDSKIWECALFIDAIETAEFTFNTEGWHMGIFSECKQSYPFTPSVCSCNSSWQFIAHQLQKKHSLHAVSIVNEQNNLLGSSQGDVLFFNNSTIHVISTSILPLTKATIAIARKLGYSIIEQKTATAKELMQADEVCILHPIHGIRWVSKVDDTVFGCKHVKKLWQAVVKDMLRWE